MPAADFDGARVDLLVRAILERAPGERLVIEALSVVTDGRHVHLRDQHGALILVAALGTQSASADSAPDALAALLAMLRAKDRKAAGQ